MKGKTLKKYEQMPGLTIFLQISPFLNILYIVIFRKLPIVVKSMRYTVI